MKTHERKELESKRDELIVELFEQGYTLDHLSVVFNRHPKDIKKTLENSDHIYTYDCCYDKVDFIDN